MNNTKLIYIKEYDNHLEVSDYTIAAYDSLPDTKEPDYTTVGILNEVCFEYGKLILKALNIESLDKYGITILPQFKKAN